jgi:hypothetical protein
MIAGQILHFKGGVGRARNGQRPSSFIRHPPFVTLNLFQGLTFDVKIDTLGE